MMKRLFVAVASLALASASLRASVVLNEAFDYPDGAIVFAPATLWSTHSGTTGQVDVASGKLNLTQAEGEDINALLQGQPYSSPSTDSLYAKFMVNFSALPSGANGGYFAHFKDASTGFRAKVFATTNGAVTGLFRLGIAAASNLATNTFPQDLNPNQDYTVVIRWALDAGASTLWINPTAESDGSVNAADTGTPLNIVAFALRQTTSMGTLTVDDLSVGTSFADVIGAVVPPQPARIAIEPVNQEVFEGGTVLFMTQVAGTPPLFIQWLKDDLSIANATNAVLVLTNVTASQAGLYQVTVSNAYGFSPSQRVTLTVNTVPQPPVITAQPQNQTVASGSNASFTVAATGSLPLMYQWQFQGASLDKETNTTLSLANVTTNQAGVYSVIVSNSIGFTNSADAILTVTVTAPPLATPIADLRKLVDEVNYLPTDTNTIFTAEGIVTTFVNMTSGTANISFYMQDDSAGICVFWSGGASQFMPKAGDRVRVTSPLTHFNGLLELNPMTAKATHSVTLVSTNNPLPAPTPLVFSWQNEPPVIEPQEGKYMVASNVFLDLTSANFSSATAGRNLTITNEAGETFVLFVNAQTDLNGQTKPIGPVTVYGVLGQFDSNDPRTSAYQIIPSRFADIVSASKAATILHTNYLENLVRPGDQPVNTFAEQSLRPGEKLTIVAQVSDSDGKQVTLTTPAGNLPSNSRWTLSANQGTNLTATFVFEPVAADAGMSYRVQLLADNGSAVATASWLVYVPTPAEQQVVLSEFLANPATADTAAQFNPLHRDPPSTNPSQEDEYLELVNLSNETIDLAGWMISDLVQLRHKFYESFSLAASNAVVIYGGPLNGSGPNLAVPAFPASESSAGLALNNTGTENIVVRNAGGNLVLRVVYNETMVSAKGSVSRFPTLSDPFVPQVWISNSTATPGSQYDGSAFDQPPAPLLSIPAVTVAVGPSSSMSLNWLADPTRSYSVWQTENLAIRFGPRFYGLRFTNAAGQFIDNTATNATQRFFWISTP